MSARRTVLAIVLGVAVLSGFVHAQWLNYPTAGIPRTAGGKPDLSAPAPRTADGKPDFSGVWDVEHNRPCPPEGCADMPVGQEFINIGWSLKGGLPYLPWAAAITKKRTEDLRVEDPTSFCLPIGIVRLHTMALLKKIDSDAGTARHSQRAQRHLSADLHRRTAPAGRIRIRRGSGIPRGRGKATRWSCRPRASATGCGSTPTAVR